MLVYGGLNDPRFHFWEPTKYVAKFRDIKAEDNLLLLKMNTGAGHGGVTGLYERFKGVILDNSFLMHSLDIS